MSPFIKNLAALALALTISASGVEAQEGKPISKETKDAVLKGVTRIVENTAFVPVVDFARWPEFVDKQKEAIEKATTDSEFSEAINRELSRFFGISHIVLITPRAAQARVERKAVGIGVSIALEEEGLRVMTVFPDTPASKAGIEPGDLILEADGKKLTAPTGMLGDEGTTVKVKVRKADGETKELSMVRQKFSNVRADTLNWVDADTAVLKVHTFDISYDRKKIDELMSSASKAKNLIVDLRSNGGGVVFNMMHLLGHLVPPDKEFGKFINRSMVKRYAEENKDKPLELRAVAEWSKSGGLKPLKLPEGPFSGNMAVLVNGGTGSASEITAAAMKELRGAAVVGTRSAGAVLVSTMAPLADGWMLQFPLMDYITLGGVRLEGNGVSPDVEAPTPRFKEPDQGIEKALALLKRAQLREMRGSKPPPRAAA